MQEREREAEEERRKAEVEVQAALQRLAAKTTLLKAVSVERTTLEGKRSVVAMECMERAVAKAAEETARLKMQQEKEAMAKLPKIPRLN